MTKLTPRTESILLFIQDCHQDGFLPSFREVAEHFEITTPNGAAYHIRELRLRGYLWCYDKPTGIRLTKEGINYGNGRDHYG